MSKKPKTEAPEKLRDAAGQQPTLGGLLAALERNVELTPTRRRDLMSAVNKVADLLRQEPAAVPLDMPAISGKLALISAVAVRISPKRLLNIRSDFRAAVKASGMMPVPIDRRPLSPGWTALFERLSGRRAHIGLSRLARYAGSLAIEPEGVVL